MVRLDREIQILPPTLANQIAAGEVVERPASIVKELIENALDAKASRIEIEIEKGGVGLVRVVDDGTGMGPWDAEQSLQRHATSKIRSSEDLFAIRTLGFRGEALPSMAAVSRFRIITRLASSPSAYAFQWEEGAWKERGLAVGAPVGTTIEVRDLFYNLPARLKFLKGESTEFGHIQETVIRVALAFPSVHFRLYRGGKKVLDVPPHHSLLERAQVLLQSRARVANKMVLYAAQEKVGPLHIEACLGDPAEAASTARNIYLLVNQRFVRDRSLLHAITQAYEGTLPEGRFPTAVVHIRLPGEQVDVNVHPQKLEVRFEHPQEIYAMVRQALRKTISRTPWLLQSGNVDAPYDPSFSTSQNAWWIAESKPAYSVASAGTRSGTNLTGDFLPTQPLPQVQQIPLPSTGNPEILAASPPERILFHTLHYLGQVYKTYLLCEHQQELVVVDQHAAHERVAFSRLQKAQQQRALRSQRLLLPLTLDLDPTRAALVEEHKTLLQGLGFSLRAFGGSSFAVEEVPDMAFFGRGAKIHHEPLRLLEKVLDDLSSVGTSRATQKLMDQVLATVACHSVVRAGDVLDHQAVHALFAAMDEIDYLPYCPHGRPVLIRLPKSEWDRRFGRIG